MRRLAGECRDSARRLMVAVREDRAVLWALGLIFVAGFFIRWHYIGRPFQADEATSYFLFARAAWYQVLAWYSSVNNHIFHTFLVNRALTLGNSLAMIRLPAFVAGLLTIPMMYVLGRRLYSREVGLLAAALVAVSAPLVDYSTNARGYSLVVLFTVLAWTNAAALLSRPGIWAWTGLVVFPALGIWTIPVMLCPYAALLLWLGISALLTLPKSEFFSFSLKVALSVAATAVLTLVFYAPVLLAMGVERILHAQSPRIMESAEIWGALPGMLKSMGHYYSLGYPAWLSGLVLLAVVLGLRPRRSEEGARLQPLYPLIFFAILMIAIPRRMPVGGFGRTFLFIVPFVLLAAARGGVVILGGVVRKNKMMRTRVGIGIACLAVLGLGPRVAQVGWMSALSTDLEREYDENEPIVLYLKPLLKPKDQVLVASGTHGFPLTYYFEKHGLARYRDWHPEDLGDIYMIRRKNITWDHYADDLLAPVKDQYAEPEHIKDFRYSSIFLYRRMGGAEEQK